MFNNPTKSACIDLIVTYGNHSNIQVTMVIETGLSGFQKMIATVMKKCLRKGHAWETKFWIQKVILTEKPTIMELRCQSPKKWEKEFL